MVPQFSEIHSVTTTQYGMVILDIGRGNVEAGIFEDIKWGETAHFLKLELDETGGSNYKFLGTSELLSVPYSLNSGSVTLTSPNGTNYEVPVDNNGNLVAVCFPDPSIADAGPDQLNILFPDTLITLAANNPVIGFGIWTIISGTGGIIINPDDPESEFTGLPGNTYTLRWTISNACGFTEDDMNISFNCPPVVTDIEGNTYNTVTIGNQCWMAENLKTTKYNNGDNIAYPGNNNTAWASNTIGAYAWYDNDISWKDLYGALYNWYAVVNIKGLCPTGWHVPSTNELDILTGFIGGTAQPHGNELKSCRQVNSPLGGDCNTIEHPRWDENPSYYGTDDYGFAGLPGGGRHFDGASFIEIGKISGWWDSTEFDIQKGNGFRINHDSGEIVKFSDDKNFGIGVRCLRD
ncbi:MAG: FISUMP domain-containing protein [Bacteroidales bacterium]